VRRDDGGDDTWLVRSEALDMALHGAIDGMIHGCFVLELGQNTRISSSLLPHELLPPPSCP
jgi:hypothetical protein